MAINIKQWQSYSIARFQKDDHVGSLSLKTRHGLRNTNQNLEWWWQTCFKRLIWQILFQTAHLTRNLDLMHSGFRFEFQWPLWVLSSREWAATLRKTVRAPWCNTLQHTAVHCNILQDIGQIAGLSWILANTPHHMAKQCETRAHNTLQHTSTHCNCDFWCDLLVPLTEEIGDWDQNASEIPAVLTIWIYISYLNPYLLFNSTPAISIHTCYFKQCLTSYSIQGGVKA